MFAILRTCLSPGFGKSPDYLHQQDRWLPGVPEQGLDGLRHCQRQELRDEHPGPTWRRRICKFQKGASLTAVPKFFFHQFCSRLLHRGSSQYPSSSKQCGTAPNW